MALPFGAKAMVKSGDMTENGCIPKTKTVLESGECTDNFSSMREISNSQSPVKKHPNAVVTRIFLIYIIDPLDLIK